MLNKERAFTLAETLITIGIIGVVSALVIPNLINAYQKRVFTAKLKVVYTKLMTAQRAIEDEYGAPDSWEFTHYRDSDNSGNQMIFDRYVEQLNPISVCNGYFWTLVQKDKLCGFSYPNIYFLNGEKGVGEFYSDWIMQLKNGATIVIVFTSFSGGVKWTLSPYFGAFVIDVNGQSLPNTFGKDIFVFLIKNTNKDAIIPYDKENDCNKEGKGFSCAKEIIDANWRINYY